MRQASLTSLGMILLLGITINMQPEQAISKQFGMLDAVYHNGKIVTVNSNFDVVQALAVADGRIVAVGRNDEIKALAGGRTSLIDLGGKTVVPGFYDGHVHLMAGPGPDVQNWSHVRTLEELQKVLRQQAAQIKKGEWVQGDLTYGKFSGELPDRWQLDKVVPDHPVAITRGAHIMVVNSLALKKAGITSATPNPPGGRIVKDERGEPTGRLEEVSAWRLVWKLAPWRMPRDEEARANIRRQLEHLLSLGITSINLAGVLPFAPDNPYRYIEMYQLRWIQGLYEAMGERLPRLTVQIRLYPGYEAHVDPFNEGAADAIEKLENIGFYTGFGNDRLKLGAVKMSIDGGAEPWYLQPYADRPNFTGNVRIPPEVFYRVAKKAHQLGWQLGIHASGDAAVKMVVDTMERILKENPREGHRHYIHHVNLLPPEETLKKMARLGIGVSIQPNFIYRSGSRSRQLGDRVVRLNPQKSLVQYGIKIGYGSDGDPYGPLFGIWCAVNRIGADGKVYNPNERLSVEDAIRYYTLGSAYLTFDEKERGSLEVGKMADFVVLSEDILTVEPSRIKDIKILQTIVGGRVVYSSK